MAVVEIAMSRRRTRRSAISLNLPASPLTIKLDTGAAIPVQLSAPPPPPASPFWRIGIKLLLLLMGSLALTVVSAAMWLKYTYFFPATASGPHTCGNLSISVTHPRHIAFGDENELLVTITNKGPDEIDATMTVVFEGPAWARPLPSDAPNSTIIKLEKLPREASVSHRLKFDLLAPASGGEYAGLAFGSGDWGTCPAATPIRIPVAPVRYANSFADAILNRTNLFAVFVAIVLLFWDAFRKRVIG
jgi:hypothetical protein